MSKTRNRLLRRILSLTNSIAIVASLPKQRFYGFAICFAAGLTCTLLAQEGKLSEMKSRRYFQQLIQAASHCHDKGVYHRDLKLENLLPDSDENLKVSDFGFNALTHEGVTLLYITCGTPNYVAPEVLSRQGYNGAAADVWSCGVILYVLMAGYLPFK